MMDMRNGEKTELYDGITITLLFLKGTLTYSESSIQETGVGDLAFTLIAL